MSLDKKQDEYFIRLRKLKDNMNLLISVLEREGVGYTTVTGECPEDYIALLEQNGYSIEKIENIKWRVSKNV